MKIKELLKSIFGRKNYASPYYGKGNKALFTMPMSPIPMQQQEREREPVPKETAEPVQFTPTKAETAEPDWEQRRFELAWKISLQERRSVVLGKLKATDRQIASKARCLSDAIIKELQTHPYKRDDDKGRHNSDE